jgi:hypothetical protein
MRTQRRKEAKTLTGRVWLMENSTLLLLIAVVILYEDGQRVEFVTRILICKLELSVQSRILEVL